MSTLNTKPEDHQDLLAVVYDAVMAYVEAVVQPDNAVGADESSSGALLRTGLARVLYALTDSREDVRMVCNDAIAEYDALDLDRREAALAEFLTEREHAVPDEDCEPVD